MFKTKRKREQEDIAFRSKIDEIQRKQQLAVVLKLLQVCHDEALSVEMAFNAFDRARKYLLWHTLVPDYHTRYELSIGEKMSK